MSLQTLLGAPRKLLTTLTQKARLNSKMCALDWKIKRLLSKLFPSRVKLRYVLRSEEDMEFLFAKNGLAGTPEEKAALRESFRKIVDLLNGDES